MPDSAIRYSLTRDDETFSPRNLTTMGSNPNRRVDFGTISPDETINYTLKIWIAMMQLQKRQAVKHLRVS